MHARTQVFLPISALAFLLAPSTPTEAAPARARVDRIVFIGKKKACHCTKRQISDGWKALKAGLGKRQTPVKRIQADVHIAEAGRYKKKHAYRALPAIYFLTSTGKVIDLLQGIVTTADVKQVLKGR